MAEKAAFDLWDTDGSGSIAKKDIGVVVRSLGGAPSEEALTAIEAAAADKVDFAAFSAILAAEKKTVCSETELMEAFATFDRDGAGEISVAEFRHIMSNLGEKIDDGDIDEILHEGKVDGGQVKYGDFVKMLCAA
jgi:Ca2+-binding EF-hand superfamily protein